MIRKKLNNLKNSETSSVSNAEASRTNSVKTRRGITSITLVSIMVIVFGVITLGFTRLMMSEGTQTTNDDLAQSAYDSALAGVEDAKVALLKYHECISRGWTVKKVSGKYVPVNPVDLTEKDDGTGCGQVSEKDRGIMVDMVEGMEIKDCDVVTNVLNRTRESDGSVTVQETQTSSQVGNSKDMLQAYTCVTIEEDLSDYRSTLAGDSRTRMIPIRTTDVDDVKYIDIKWYSTANAADTDVTRYTEAGTFPNFVNREIPPVIEVQFFQADATFNLSELSTSHGNGSGGSVGTDRGVLYLQPVESGGTNQITEERLSKSTDKNVYSANTGDPETVLINCSPSGEFYCTARLIVPNTFRNSGDKNQGAMFINVSLPYGSPETDFSVNVYRSDGTKINFSSVQARIDSTGRTNDIYRRIETRADLIDVYYPYPEFEITVPSGSDHVLDKYFYATRHCTLIEDGDKSACSNYMSKYEDNV